ncbi:MAG TPA: endonuclease VII domain-containing protein [Acidimicrobiia bacterium]
MRKRCRRCGETKPLDAYYRDRAARDGHRPECKACTGARRRAWYRANREREIRRVVSWQQRNRDYYNERQREYRRENREAERLGHLRRTFGLTLEDYERALTAQLGRCAICRRKPGTISLHVDHDHRNGKVRGLLCFRCNGGLGQFKENPAQLVRAAEYLAGDVVPLSEERALVRRVRKRARELRVAS